MNSYKKISVLIFSLSRSNSGASVESVNTPLKVIEKDTLTGDYIVRMSPDDFDRLANQGRVVQPIGR